MIKFVEISINTPDDYDKLKKEVDKSHIDDKVIEILKKFVNIKCDKLLVEYPYYDSDYLSNYYSYYSQKFRMYCKACYRLHFEKGDDYLGYTVLRPTPEGTKLGRTHIQPEMLVSGVAYLMLSTFVSHIYGEKAEIACFPWKRQESDISCCAHTATWAVLKYFGNKYKNYCDTTIGEIVEKVKNDRGRKTPTLGLAPNQVSEVFKEYNFSPVIIDKTDDYSFCDEVLAYVESGLPMVGFFNMSPTDHAVAIVGHGTIDYDLADDVNSVDQQSGVILSTKLIRSVYVMDDRYFPYIEIPKGLPTKESSVDYGMSQMTFAVVPLYRRMLLTYRDIYSRMITWFKAGDFQFGDKPICRMYITSSNSLKEKTKQCSNMNRTLKETILSLSLPKFVWCIDFSDINSYRRHKTTGRIIVDTTAGTIEKEPWILKHDGLKFQYKELDGEDSNIHEVNVGIKPYDMYKNNLEEVKGWGKNN